MASTYSGRVSKPVGLNEHAFGGAGHNLGLEAVMGETEMITTFDDFNGVIPNTALAVVSADAATGHWSDRGWVTTEDATVTAVADTLGMNDPADLSEYFHSSIRIFPGTADDSGGNMQLDILNSDVASGANHLTSLSTGQIFPHLWVPASATATTLDNTVWVFACRIGLRADVTTTGAGLWDAKAYIGWAAAGDTSIMDHTGGALTDAVGTLHGFHIGEDGSIDGITKRIIGDSLVSGTNFTELYAAASVDGTVANGAVTAGDTMWFDLALRMSITDMSDNAANGKTEFFTRRVSPVLNIAPGLTMSNSPGGTWARHGTVLQNQTPNHSVNLVPTIEVLNGDTAGRDCVFFLDWWAMGCSRYSRTSK